MWRRRVVPRWHNLPVGGSKPDGEVWGAWDMGGHLEVSRVAVNIPPVGGYARHRWIVSERMHTWVQHLTYSAGKVLATAQEVS